MKLIRIDPKIKIDVFSVPNNVLTGQPETGAANFYSDKGGKFHCGIWQSSPGKWRIEYTEEEFCLLIEGEAILTSDAGHQERFKEGDAFVIPSGFKGTWETINDLRKYYVILEG